MDFAFATALGLFILIWLYSASKRARRSPPGPWALPIVGNLVEFALRGPLFTLTRWAAKYGPVYSYSVGNQKIVVVTDTKLVKELFATFPASGRPRNPFWSAYTNYYGIAFSDGPNWDVQRRFLIKSLKMFGFGKASILQCRVLEEFTALASIFENNFGYPIDGSGLFHPFLVGTLWGLIAPDIDSKGKQEALELVDSFICALNAASQSGLMFFPELRFIAPEYFGWTSYTNSISALREFVTKLIDKSRAQLDPSHPTGFIEHFLIEMESSEEPNSTFYRESGYKNLSAVVSDVFLGSIDTTGKTLEWAMIYLSQQVDIQRKLQIELDSGVGKSRTPCISDRSMLPYTEAVILEILRFSSIGPLGFPHRLTEDAEFHGFLLEKDSILMASLITIHHDPNIWGNDAGRFNPERFLSEDKTKVIRSESFMPFSVGKRKCLGDNVAMDTLFLFITCIFQNFNVNLDPDCQGNVSSNSGLSTAPKPFRVVIFPRD